MKSPPREIPILNEKEIIRFWKWVNKRPDGIWEWKGGKNSNGYGVFGIGRTTFLAHRISWTLVNGPIPAGLYVLHRNDVTSELFDINPNNLWIGTQKENMADMYKKGRANIAYGDASASRLHMDTRPRGEDFKNAKLTGEKVKEIRSLHGKISQRAIGRLYGICHTHVGKILKGEKWRHIV